MPSQRAQGKKLLNMWIDDDLLLLIEHARKRIGVDRSRFARDALVYYLKSLGYPLDETAGAPARDRDPIQQKIELSPIHNHGTMIGNVDTLKTPASKSTPKKF